MKKNKSHIRKVQHTQIEAQMQRGAVRYIKKCFGANHTFSPMVGEGLVPYSGEREHASCAKRTEKNLSLFTSHFSREGKRYAFTLAEVLITLGIIGVVAAVTLPTVIQNHRKSVVETRLAKAYSTFSNALRFSQIDNGDMRDWPTGDKLNMDEFWNVYMKPYFNGAKLCKRCFDCGYPKNCASEEFSEQWTNAHWGLQSSDSRILFQLADGTVIFFPRNTTTYQGQPSYTSELFIDINGSQKPNELARDVFRFRRDYEKGTITSSKGECSTNKYACTYEIMSNGWKIPKDYPYRL